MIADGAGQRWTKTAVSDGLTPGAMPGHYRLIKTPSAASWTTAPPSAVPLTKRQGRVRELVIATLPAEESRMQRHELLGSNSPGCAPRLIGCVLMVTSRERTDMPSVSLLAASASICFLNMDHQGVAG